MKKEVISKNRFIFDYDNRLSIELGVLFSKFNVNI